MRTPIRISRVHNAKQLTSRGCPRPAKKVEDDDDVCTGAASGMADFGDKGGDSCGRQVLLSLGNHPRPSSCAPGAHVPNHAPTQALEILLMRISGANYQTDAYCILIPPLTSRHAPVT